MIFSCRRSIARALVTPASTCTNTIPQSCPSAAATTINCALFNISSHIPTHSPKNTHKRPIHSTPTPLDNDLDNLCQNHMKMHPTDFLHGCSFLHQVALGNTTEILSRIREKQNDSDNSNSNHPRCNPADKLINFRDYDRRTPLHIAASEGHIEICDHLLQNGARINRSDRWGGSPMDDAYRHRHFHVMELLRSHGGTFGSSSQATNFITAASEGDKEEVVTLWKHGDIDIDEGDYDKRTALHLAAGNGFADIVEFLCEEGADVNVMDRWNNRPLDDAKQFGDERCIEILMNYGGKPGSLSEGCSYGREALVDLFEQYSKVIDGKVTLDWHGVASLLHGLGHENSDEVVQKLFEAVDDDDNGLISKDEFLDHSDLFLQGRPARIILVVGGPGSGKGLLSERLVKECGVIHLSSGDLLRAEVEAGTSLGKHVDDIMKSGGLVSSAIMVALMQKRMKDHPGKRILLDGFPRSAENAKDLVTLCGRPELALHLECDDTILIERILARGKSGARKDDNIHTALERIRTYHKFHKVTLNFLRDEHVPIVNLDCSATADGVWEQLRAVGRLMRKAIGPNTVLSGDVVRSSNERKSKDDNLSIPA